MDDDLRTYLKDGGPLPTRLASEFGDDDKNLASLSNWSFKHRWAWEELQRRLRVCLDQGRPPTGVLAYWAATVAVGRTPPRHNANEDRDWRVLAVVNLLVSHGNPNGRRFTWSPPKSTSRRRPSIRSCARFGRVRL